MAANNQMEVESTGDSSAPQTDVKRYDRQLRLWGEDGQARLEASNICLLNASATGCETLKNLVLPGVGAFTIVDGKKVDETDFNNFFIDEASLGKPRASATVALLNELNDRVKGKAFEVDPVHLVNTNIEFLHPFNVIIASNLPEETVQKVAQYAWNHNKALLVSRAWGLVAYLRTVVPEHQIIESKPDNPNDDLRLSTPWTELSEYAASFNFEEMDSAEHAHIPYVIILLQAIEKWKAEHGGAVPSTMPEKRAFKDAVARGAKKSTEENFSEAYKTAHKAFTPYSIPENVRAVLSDPKAKNITANSDAFWILAAAVREFVENEGHGLLPLNGAIPDMHSTTEGFIALQKIYGDKAARDVEAVASRVKTLLSSVGKPLDWIKPDQIKKFCRNSQFITMVRYRSLEEEHNPQTAKKDLIASKLSSNKNDNIVWYIVLRAAELFNKKVGRYPGSEDAHVHADVEELKKYVRQLLDEFGVSHEHWDDIYVQEIVRYGGSELHTIASFLGGVTSQEVIKVITGQYTPQNNTFIYNGLQSTSDVWAL